MKPIGITITPERDHGENGNPNWQPLNSIPHCVIDMNRPVADDERSSRRSTQAGSLFAPRGCGLKDGDRFTYQNVTFGIVGNALWDMDHPLSGDDFGYVEYVIRKGG